jgi:murein DD-endopeptidase MepM/ murein hydrolase activator NlpD
MPGANVALAFGALLAGAIVIDYGVKSTRTAFASSPSGSAASASSTASGNGAAVIDSLFGAQAGSVAIKRRDQGRDLQGAPGSNITAPGAGTVIRNGYDPSGFGISYPIVHFSTGPWAGLDVYIGHIRSAVSAGEQIVAGQVLGTTQNGSGAYVGNATGLPGWAEIGLAPNGNPGPNGQPLPPGL